MFAGRPIIGIAGGIGSGKSHIARLLGEMGCAVIEKLNQLEIEYARQKGLGPGEESVLLRDPAGNWVEVAEITSVI